MSASLQDWLPASAESLLTGEECLMLLDNDILGNDDDLLKVFPAAASKIAEDLNKIENTEDVNNTLYPPSPPDSKPSRAQLANDLLQQLESQFKQENLFSNWLEEKVELFDNILPERTELPLSGAPLAVPVPVPVAQFVPQPPPTEELLREFETVYGAVELTHLTPPQSPPGPASQLLQSYAYGAVPPPATQWQQPDYDRELTAVDELVRRRAAELTSEEQVASADSSPRSSPPSSPRSSSADEEWCVPQQRGKPYARSDDRRSRKKEQNKNAATRYRQKKKAEVEVLLSEEHGLRQRHNDLGSKCTDLQREISYLKGLMRDLFKAKGLIK